MLTARHSYRLCINAGEVGCSGLQWACTLRRPPAAGRTRTAWTAKPDIDGYRLSVARKLFDFFAYLRPADAAGEHRAELLLSANL